jgi:hypothetical protein
MNALEWVRWYNKIVWNMPGDEPPPNCTVEPCHCGKKHGAHPCNGWTLKFKSKEQLRKERPPVIVDIPNDEQVTEALKNKKQIQKQLTEKIRKHK